MTEYLHILSESEIFNNLDKTQLSMVNSLCEVVKFNVNDIIYKENSIGSDLFIVMQGLVNIVIKYYYRKDNSKEKHKDYCVAVLRRGQSFGTLNFIDQGVRSTSAITAINNTMLLKIPHKKLRLFCEHYPEMGYKIVNNIASELTLQIRNLSFLLQQEIIKKTTN